MARMQWTFFGVPILDGGRTRVTNLTVYTSGQASQVGRFLSDVGGLSAGTLGEGEFEESWYGQSVGSFDMEWRAGHALEAVRRSGSPAGGERYRRSVRRDPR